MTRVYLCTVALAIALATGVASGARADDELVAQIEQFAPTARAAWPDSPCAGGENIVVDPRLAIEDTAGEAIVRNMYGTSRRRKLWLRALLDSHARVRAPGRRRTLGRPEFDHEWRGEGRRYAPCRLAATGLPTNMPPSKTVAINA